jgi:hypothetical protein
MTDPLETHFAELSRYPYDEGRESAENGWAGSSTWQDAGGDAPARAADWGRAAYGRSWLASAAWWRE